MKKTVSIMMLFSAAYLGLSGATQVYAGEAKVTWNNTKEKNIERTYEKLESTFIKLAKKLPEGYLLEVNVSELVLAVDIFTGRENAGLFSTNTQNSETSEMKKQERLGRWPRMNFAYILKNKSGEVIRSGQEQLKDMAYMDQMRAEIGGQREVVMLQDWFRLQLQENHFPNVK